MVESSTIIIVAVIQTIIVFLIQLYFQRTEEYIKEKNKIIAIKAVDYETAIFNLIRSVTASHIMPQGDYLLVANNINQLRHDHYIYLDKRINKIAQEFADYCLNVNIDLSQRNVLNEKVWLNDFRSHFKK